MHQAITGSFSEDWQRVVLVRAFRFLLPFVVLRMFGKLFLLQLREYLLEQPQFSFRQTQLHSQSEGCKPLIELPLFFKWIHYRSGR